MTPVRDATTIFVRESLPSWRSPLGLLFSMLQPLVFLALFGPLLAGIGGLPGGSSWQWFVPAILLMLALFGTTGTGYNLLTEMQTGSHERLMVTPMSRSAILAGRSLKDVVELLVQAVLIIAITIPLGFTLHPVGALLGLGLLALVGLGVGALSHALAIACRRQQEMFYMVQQTLLFPLLLLSGLLLPLEMGPAWMSTVGALNPFTYVVEALRTLFSGTVADLAVLHGWAAAAALAVLGLALGDRGMSRAES
ncbi:ABC-2 type transport system permease protein [Lipingzhangella halophila]|uniref:Transport permease protein n=1 Tax=Lipingzhangella halophila TaxID=1783352 RepID=A0A7W7RD03_9ACTN|nr:ABC transporter permease [Lipingzhangella halophila]MBB4929747.1 ABC-2 type transport system permease protein [Lipingzhangella halophila]